MNNSVYGKTMEYLRKIVKHRLVNNTKDYKNMSKNQVVPQKILGKNFVAIHEVKPVLTLDKRIYVGFSILDLSKLLMYEFHYKYIGTKYDIYAKLLFTDIDSLVDEIETDDAYKDFYENKNLFDFSDYPEDSKFFDPVNKKVIGKKKDEFRGKIISKLLFFSCCK